MKTYTRIGLLMSIISFSLFSCTAYQYATLDSELPKSQYNDFFFENDSLQIVYSFDGSNCPLSIDIFNKLDKPLFIDWTKSAIIINGQTTPLMQNESIINGEFDAATYKIDKHNSVTEGYNYGTIQHPEHIGFIPPKAQLKVEPINLINTFLDVNSSDSIESTKIFTKNSEALTVKKHHFSPTNTPFQFRCYMSYSDKAKLDSMRVADNKFWVSCAFNSTSNAVYSTKDQFKISKTTGLGGVMIGVGLVTILAVTSSYDTADDFSPDF